MADDHGNHFVCVECGRHIISLVRTGYEPLCSVCVTLPGWFKIPEVRAAIDPSHSGRDPADPEETVNE